MADQSVKCRVCGAENPPGAEYCDSCGVKLEAASPKTGGDVDKLLEELIEVAPAEQGATPAKGGKEGEGEKEMVDELLDSLLIEESTQSAPDEFECPLCGTALPSNAEVCTQCGARFETVAAKKEAEEEAAPVEEAAPRPEKAKAAEIPVAVAVTEEDVSKLKVSHGRLIDITVLGTLIAALVIFAAGGMYDSSKISENPTTLIAFIVVVVIGSLVGFLILQRSSSAMAQGDKLVKEGNYQDAIYYYDRAIRMGTRPASAWTSKGVALKRLGNYDDALHCQNVALKLDPQNEIAWCNKGDIFFRTGDHKKAIGCYDKALEIKPKYAIAWNNKGAALAMSKRFREAKTCQDMAVKLKPKYMAAWLNRGEVLAKLGMRDEAAKCLERAKSLGA